MKALIPFIFLTATIVLSGCISTGEVESNVAQEGDTVQVDYWLTVEGEQLDTSEGRGPLTVTLGSGEVIPGFDKAIRGMKVGEEKTVELSGTDAYTRGPLAGKVLHFRIILREIS